LLKKPAVAAGFFMGEVKFEDYTYPVGAGLPAMVACQTTLMLNVLALSLASQLPQGVM
jgi:hypothetical protein